MQLAFDLLGNRERRGGAWPATEQPTERRIRMLAFILFLVIVAIVLGIVGVVVKGLLWLLWASGARQRPATRSLYWYRAPTRYVRAVNSGQVSQPWL
jgi:hypothetical protein